MAWEKYMHLGLGVISLGLSFTADAMSIPLSEDTIWMLRGFAGAALSLGALKLVKEKALTPAKPKDG